MSSSSIRVCAACGQKNRVPARRLADPGVCGQCKAALPPASEPVEVDTVAFDEIVSTAKVPVLVDFWATWCPPCRMVAPEVEKTARAAAGKAIVLKVDIDKNPELQARFGIQSIPTFGVFRAGKAVSLQPGAIRSPAMLRLLA